MRLVLTAACALFAAVASAADPVELAGMKSTPPAEWKVVPPKPGTTPTIRREITLIVPKAEGDPEDAEVAVFKLQASGTVQQNLQRQVDKFEIPAEKKKDDVVKVDKVKVGPIEGTRQDIQATFLSKFPPFAPNAKVTKKENWRQVYVVFEKGDDQYYLWLMGPAKTVEKHKAGFEDWLKNFK